MDTGHGGGNPDYMIHEEKGHKIFAFKDLKLEDLVFAKFKLNYL